MLANARSRVGSKDKIMRFDWGNVQTKEGTVAYDEAIKFLQHVSPMHKLEVSSVMCRANRRHAADLEQNSTTGHEGSDGSTSTSRVRDLGGIVSSPVLEAIEYGPWKDGAHFVMGLIVDDGNTNRDHRKIILDPAATVCGIAMGNHPQFAATCVVTVTKDCRLRQ